MLRMIFRRAAVSFSTLNMIQDRDQTRTGSQNNWNKMAVICPILLLCAVLFYIWSNQIIRE